ncbi:MAG: hypothetical protein D6734_03735, partial [Candidatus Schekmanbacteria bacterium]
MTLDEIKKKLKTMEDEYTDFISGYFQNWELWADASERIYRGEEVSEREVPKAFHTEMKMMKMILKMEKSGDFDWNNPVVKKMFSEFSQSSFYKYFGETIVKVAFEIASSIECRTLLEVGAGNGNLTRKMVRQMKENDKNISLLISDSKDLILPEAKKIEEEYDFHNIDAFLWNISEPPPKEVEEILRPPVLCYERYTITYTSPDVVKNIASVSDVLVMGD